MKTDSNTAVTFDCHLCGECCSSWNIPVESDKAWALLEKPWVQDRLRAVNRSLVPVSDGLHRIPLTDENWCVFLADDRRCLIEIHEGHSLKPHECQRFPFATVALPNGQPSQDTSAACKYIAETLLLAFKPIVPRASAMAEPADIMADFPERVRIQGRQSLDWQTYQAALKNLASVFDHPNATFWHCLHEARRQLSALTKSPHPLSPAFTKSPPPREAGGNGFERLLWLGGDFMRGLGRRGILIGFLRKPYGTYSWTQLLWGRRYDDPRVFGLPLPLGGPLARIKRLSEASVTTFEQAGLAYSPVLKAFLYNILCRQMPIARGQSFRALLAMTAVASLLVVWYTEALTRMGITDDLPHPGMELEPSPPRRPGSITNGSDQPENSLQKPMAPQDGPRHAPGKGLKIPEAGETGRVTGDQRALEDTDSSAAIPELTMAIRLVERYYTGHQPRFARIFDSGWKSWLVLKILRL